MSDPHPPSRLTLRSVRKRFGATQALDGVNLEVGAGEVHAIIGENGAGKSTLVKILSGAHQADSGEMTVDGVAIRFQDPGQSRNAGIAMIYQELNLAPDLSAAENITLGREPHRLGWVNRRQQRQLARAALQRLGCEHLPLTTPVHRLSIAQRQMVEIARALQPPLAGTQYASDDCATDLRILILDEPTSSLTKLDVEQLFAVIKRLSATGVSVLYISHFLEECEQIADRFTVLRDGKSVGHGRLKGRLEPEGAGATDNRRSGQRSDPARRRPARRTGGSGEKGVIGQAAVGSPSEAAVSIPEIVRMMVGRELGQLYPTFEHAVGEPILQTKRIASDRGPRGVDLTLRRGMILGLAGLIGAGRTETVRAVFGLDRIASGEVIINGRTTTRRSPQRSWTEDSMGLLSEDRKTEGLFLNLSLIDNVTLTRNRSFRRGPLLDHRNLWQETERWMSRLEVRARDAGQAVGELSGGNQQKIAFARLLHHDCQILLLDEPTRGIDIGSKRVIYRTIGELAASGRAILLVSSYLPELLGLCDTIGVMSRGRLVDLRPVSQWDEHSLLSAAIGQAEATEHVADLQE